MALSSSSKSLPPPTPPHQSPLFTPIQECEREEQEGGAPSLNKAKGLTPKHLSTPPNDKNIGKPNASKRRESGGGWDGSVICNNCRPNSFSMASPNGIFHSVFHSLTRKSPKSTDMCTGNEEHWKFAASELSHKLIQATRKRDEALQEASRLKYSMAELEKKLNKLEVYCHNLKSGLDECNINSPYRIDKTHSIHQVKNQDGVVGANKKMIQQFLVSVSEARSSIRLLSRSLITMQLRHMGTKVYERLSVLLRPYDTNISHSNNPKSLLLYLEALLNKAFFEDFESNGFQKSAATLILNPIDRCEANMASFKYLQGITWEEVLNKGTRHFSEEFSKFSDRKMNEIVGMLGWNRAWPEPLLQAFFGASKSVWLVHLLANSVHPGLPTFRVEKGVRFDSVYMEDTDGERARNLVPSRVRIMITPGFYVYGTVVKCKVICSYANNMV